MNSSNAHTIAVTGASSALGRALLSELAKVDPLSHFVLLEHRTPVIVDDMLVSRTKIVRVNVEDPASLFRTLTGVDILVHMAAVTHTNEVALYREVNVLGTGNLLREAKKADVKHVVYVSTTALGELCGSYGDSKKHAEELVLASGMPCTIIRFSEVYGSGGREGIDQLVEFIPRCPVIPYVSGTFMAPLYVLDAVSALVRAILLPPSAKTYVLSGPAQLSFREVVRAVASVTQKRALFVAVPKKALSFLAKLSSMFRAPDQVQRLLCEKNYNNVLAKSDLAFTPRSFAEGLRDMQKRS